MHYNLVDFGDIQRVAGKLEACGFNAANTIVAMEAIGADMMRVTGINFDSRGHRGGGSWRQLRPKTVERKGNTQILKTAGSNPKYGSLGNKDTLFHSLTQPNADYHILVFNNSTLEYGTRRPGAKTQQFGNPRRKVPPRPFITFIPSDYVRWEGMISEHLMRPFTHQLMDSPGSITQKLTI